MRKISKNLSKVIEKTKMRMKRENEMFIAKDDCRQKFIAGMIETAEILTRNLA